MIGYFNVETDFIMKICEYIYIFFHFFIFSSRFESIQRLQSWSSQLGTTSDFFLIINVDGIINDGTRFMLYYIEYFSKLVLNK